MTFNFFKKERDRTILIGATASQPYSCVKIEAQLGTLDHGRSHLCYSDSDYVDRMLSAAASGRAGTGAAVAWAGGAGRGAGAGSQAPTLPNAFTLITLRWG